MPAKKKRPLLNDEVFVTYKYVEMPNGRMKRKKVFKKITKAYKIISEEQMEEINNSFSLFDRDNNGIIDTHELKNALRALGVYFNKKDL